MNYIRPTVVNENRDFQSFWSFLHKVHEAISDVAQSKSTSPLHVYFRKDAMEAALDEEFVV